MAVITVPYGSSLRKVAWILFRPLLFLKANPFLRRILNKPAAGRTPFAQAARNIVPAWTPLFTVNEEGWYFFEYEFNRAQMNQFLKEGGFSILKEFVEFKEQGILSIFGLLAGRFDARQPRMGLNRFGAFLERVIPISACGHMLCYVVQKSD